MFLALMPHGFCFLWNVWLTLLHALSDGAIAIAYFSIPTMMYLSRERATAETRPLVLMFAAFILSCGIGHILAAWNIWHGNYWLEGSWKAVTAGISLLTAWELRQRMPHIMGMHRTLTEAQNLANTDRLTGLKNRPGIEQAFQQLPLIEIPENKQHVLMLLDLDHFKEINDRFGHAVGDRLLQTVAATLTRHTRATDIVARLGGDEFAVLLIGCSTIQGRAIADTIRKEIAKLALDDICTNGDHLVTSSIGLLPVQPKQSFQEAFQAVDVLLYNSKHGGRNRITADSATLHDVLSM